MPLKHKLRPLPEFLKRTRYGVTDSQKWYARFYGLYDSIDGKIKRFSLQVKINRALSQNRRGLGMLMRSTVKELLDGKVPEHVQGEVFPNFIELFGRNWISVKRIREYHAGVVYGR